MNEPTRPKAERFYKLSADLAAARRTPPAGKIVFAILADRIGRNADCWPGVRTIASDSGLSVATVIRNLEWLATAKMLTIERPGNGRSNHYRLTGRSAPESEALRKVERSTNRSAGAPKSRAEALRKVELNQTNQLNQTHKKASGKATAPADPWQAILPYLPLALNTDRFRLAWTEWTAYRQQARKPLTPATIKRQAGQLAAFGHDGAIASIERSITQGWQGLFDPKTQGRAAPSTFIPAPALKVSYNHLAIRSGEQPKAGEP
ncbi:MAG: helix-turn-helix domain-containing protein [Phycisphaerae bacterium]|nr:helix-turn-helix domain-containing protein [Phycisphaerae bacterium]